MSGSGFMFACIGVAVLYLCCISIYNTWKEDKEWREATQKRLAKIAPPPAGQD